MQITEAQRDVRRTYAGGFHGQLVSAVLWLVAAAVSDTVSHIAGMVALVAGGVLIFPATTLLLAATGRRASLPPTHPMAALATQIAFTVPPGMLVAVAAAGYREEWFFPASMVIVGAHYLPFTFLYGMRLFTALAGSMVLTGVALALWVPAAFSVGGWAGGALLTVFAFLLRRAARRIDRDHHSA